MVRNAPQIGRDGFSVEESIFTLLRVACWDLDQTLSHARAPTFPVADCRALEHSERKFVTCLLYTSDAADE